MTPEWLAHAQNALGSTLHKLTRLGGGDFADSYSATLDDQKTVFIKTHRSPPTGFFSTEAAGLSWLRQTNTVRVPEVLAVSDEPPYLALAYVDVDNHRSKHNDEAAFGVQLAQLHSAIFVGYGRPDHRTTGSLALPNGPTLDWPTFYRERRLLPLAAIAADKRALPSNDIDKIEQLAARLEQYPIASDRASLLHGDLWAGNRVVDQHGKSWLIDPAAHGGHREFDLAMMRLFAGFDSACFEAYNNEFPLESNWEQRVPLHQLAPLIVHAIKFGGSYPAAVHQSLNQAIASC